MAEAELLSLRVMQLSLPQETRSIVPYLHASLAEVFEAGADRSTDFAIDTLNAVESNAALLLPTVQGKLHVGESFQGYLNLANISQTAALRVSLQVELQFSSSNRFVLFDNSRLPIEKLEPQTTFDSPIAHELSEPGTYTLVCSVVYRSSPYSSARHFSRLYKFFVGHPFFISHTLTHCRSDTYVQVVLENVTGNSLFLQDATIKCSEPSVSCTRQETSTCQHTRKPHRGIHNFRRKDIYSLLFCMSVPEDTTDIDRMDLLRRMATLGHLSLDWRSSTGGGAILKDYAIDNPARSHSARPVELIVVSCPQYVEVEEQFSVDIMVVNRMDKETEPLLVIDREKMKPLFTQGIATQTVGKVAAKGRKSFSLPLTATTAGLITLRGISVYDPSSPSQPYECPSLCEVLAF
eukprot:Lankesteria_metandrocarpae@DN1565_c0_g1_i1.p1